MGSDGSGSHARAGHVTADESRLTQSIANARRLHAASNGLADKRPDFSVKQGLTHAQRCGGWSLLGALTVFISTDPLALSASAIFAISGLFVVVILLRLSAAIAALLSIKERQTAASDDQSLPVVTVLAPLYREANMAQRLFQAIGALDYPSHLLDVKILVESDDEET